LVEGSRYYALYALKEAISAFTSASRKGYFANVGVNYREALVPDELVASGAAAGSMMTVQVEVLVRPWLSVTM
jgi:hypothetical protein